MSFASELPDVHEPPELDRWEPARGDRRSHPGGGGRWGVRHRAADAAQMAGVAVTHRGPVPVVTLPRPPYSRRPGQARDRSRWQVALARRSASVAIGLESLRPAGGGATHRSNANWCQTGCAAWLGRLRV